MSASLCFCHVFVRRPRVSLCKASNAVTTVVDDPALGERGLDTDDLPLEDRLRGGARADGDLERLSGREGRVGCPLTRGHDLDRALVGRVRVPVDADHLHASERGSLDGRAVDQDRRGDAGCRRAGGDQEGEGSV